MICSVDFEMFDPLDVPFHSVLPRTILVVQVKEFGVSTQDTLQAPSSIPLLDCCLDPSHILLHTLYHHHVVERLEMLFQGWELVITADLGFSDRVFEQHDL